MRASSVQALTGRISTIGQPGHVVVVPPSIVGAGAPLQESPPHVRDQYPDPLVERRGDVAQQRAGRVGIARIGPHLEAGGRLDGVETPQCELWRVMTSGFPSADHRRPPRDRLPGRELGGGDLQGDVAAAAEAHAL